MAHQVKSLKVEIAQWEKSLQNTLATADSTSRKQDDRIKELEQSVSQLKAAKVAEEEIKKEKSTIEEARRAMDESKREVVVATFTEDKAKKALLASEEMKKELEA